MKAKSLKIFRPIYDGLPRPYDEGNMQQSPTKDKRELVIVEDDILKSIVDSTDPNSIYIGKASCGANINAAVWQIQRVITAASIITTEWADGDGKYDNIWANRATLTYR